MNVKKKKKKDKHPRPAKGGQFQTTIDIKVLQT